MTAPDQHPRETERALRPPQAPRVRIGQIRTSVPQLADDTAGDEVVVSGVTLDSRAVLPGDLYAALPGAHTHGARFAAAAVGDGAVAVLTDPAGAAQLGDLDVPVLVAPDPREVLGSVSAVVYGTADRTPELFAVTGTNGKTTTTYILRSILQGLGRHTGLIGTIEILAGDQPVPSNKTTPESPQVHAILAQMNQLHVDAVAMEVTSHALDFRRVAGVRFDIAGFTNLTHDHLDLHGTMEAYAESKLQLFTPEYSNRGVIVVDDEWGGWFAEHASVPVVTLLSRDPRPGEQADYAVRSVRAHGIGYAFELVAPDGRAYPATVDLPGLFNVTNVALALAMMLESGTDPDTLLALLERDPDVLSPYVPGRMEVVHREPTAIVDFAHNADSMQRVLSSTYPEAGRSIIVFGATGDRDREKRPVMGEVAARGADIVIITDDDPHSEDAAAIRAEVMAGALAAAPEGVRVLEIAPRADAIWEAARLAQPDDVLIVAGRGHEPSMDMNGEVVEIDDRTELRRAFAALEPERR